MKTLRWESFRAEIMHFWRSKKSAYKIMGIYNSGMGVFTTLVTIVVVVAGAVFLTNKTLEVAVL